MTRSVTHPSSTTSPTRVAIASLVGTSIEWYDFYIYGTAAALVFNTAFFPSFDPAVGTLLAFATFGVGTVCRPLGGFVFGHFGDRIGRKNMLVLSLLLMGIATVLIGVLPTYDAIGVWAPILLVALRALQGFALGGEWGGAVLMAVEHASDRRRAFLGSWPQVGSSIGLVMGTAVFTLMTWLLPEDQFQSWGWRVPFLLSVVLVVVGLVIRRTISESPEFEAAKADSRPVRMPLVEVVKRNPIDILLGIATIAGAVVPFYVVTVFVQSYATATIGMARSDILVGVMIVAVVEAIAVLLAALAADRVGTRRVGIIGGIATFVVVLPFFAAVDTGSVALTWLAMGAVGVSVGIVYGIVPLFIAELFPAHLRYSGSSASYAVAAGIIGGLSPLIAGALFSSAASAWPITVYVAVLALLSAVAFVATPARGAESRASVPTA
ncbi:MFS transporter [Pseudonocardia thermophila]|uniref:MFS transporter n=1 Tax=Pseudonocardia thermophila TaxID=1848 RepID=UPI00248E091E|nr:MFS transporter [Pseudonocardia thermophila]